MPALPTVLRRRSRTPDSASSGVVLGPDAVEVAPKHLRLGEDYAATLIVTGYPPEVGPGWLEPLLCYPGRLDVAVHIDPVPPTVAGARLRTQRGRLESRRRATANSDRLDDPDVDAAAADAADMAHAVARGESRLFRVGLYLTVHAASHDELTRDIHQLRALAAGLLMDTHPATYRAVQGWASTLPLGVDLLRSRRTLDTPALAAAFPFTSPDVPVTDPHPQAGLSGVLYGTNAGGTGLVFWDRWAQDNYNSVTLARSGAGKSYFTKLEALRSLYPHIPTYPGNHSATDAHTTSTGNESAGVVGAQVFVLDPEDEYARLTEAVGGVHIPLGAPWVRINPFDLPVNAEQVPDALTRRALFLHTLIAVLAGESLSADEQAVLDQAVIATYAAAGITSDPRTFTRPAPLLADLHATLSHLDHPAAARLAARLVPWTTGSARGLFDGPSTHHPDSHLVTFSLRRLPEEVQAVGSLLALDAVWRRVTDPRTRRRRLVVVDEAWRFMAQPEAARHLHRIAKSARKYWAGLAFVSQDPQDVLATDLGRGIVANAATQILLRQAPQALDAISEHFGLSDGETAYLAACPRGDALLLAGNTRIAFRALASPDGEHPLITTDPSELADAEGDLEP